MSISSTHVSLLQAPGEEGRREDALAVFQDGYRKAIIDRGRRHGLDLYAAEDLTREIPLGLLEALPRHEYEPGRGRFRSWPRAVVRHVLAERRRRRPEPEGVGGSTALGPLGELPSPEAVEELGVAVERRTAAREAEMLDRVRVRVEPASRAATCRRIIERWPAAEIASELGTTTNGAHVRASRVLQQARRRCAEIEGESSDDIDLDLS